MMEILMESKEIQIDTNMKSKERKVTGFLGSCGDGNVGLGEGQSSTTSFRNTCKEPRYREQSRQECGEEARHTLVPGIIGHTQ